MDGQLLWIVAFLLYVYDSASIDDRAAVLRYAIDGVTATIIMPTFVVGAHAVLIPNPLRPDYCDIPLDPNNAEKLSTLDRYFIRRASSLYLTHQVLAVGTLVILFGLTPYLVTRMNLLHACLISVGITYWLCLFHWLEMWISRRLLGIDGKTIRADIFHVLLCPPNAVNCARRMASYRRSRYGIVPCLEAFSPLQAEKYQEQLEPLTTSA